LTPEESRTTVANLDAKRRESLFKDFQREVLFQEFAAYRKQHQQTPLAYDNH